MPTLTRLSRAWTPCTGVFDYPNGDHFEGNWVDDKKEGQGVHFYFHQEKKVHTKRCALPTGALSRAACMPC